MLSTPTQSANAPTPAVPRLAVVCPCFEEQEALPRTIPQLLGVLDGLVAEGAIARESFLLLVDDGSHDGTWRIIEQAAAADARVLGMHQSRNRGQQSSLLAGLMEARDMADVVVTCDCDGQDDFGAIREMLARWREGAEVVYGVRSSRAVDNAGKRESARLYYRLLAWLGAEVVYDHADFRLCDAAVLDALAEYGEVNLFLRGMFPLMGFESAVVEYERKGRVAGRGHYSLARMASLALDGVTSTSIRPLRIIAGFGALVSVLGFAAIVWAIVAALLGHTVSGWASLMCVVSFMGGVQLLSLGVIGEYVGKTYLEAKRRPRYLIDRRTWK